MSISCRSTLTLLIALGVVFEFKAPLESSAAERGLKFLDEHGLGLKKDLDDDARLRKLLHTTKRVLQPYHRCLLVVDVQSALTDRVISALRSRAALPFVVIRTESSSSVDCALTLGRLDSKCDAVLVLAEKYGLYGAGHHVLQDALQDVLAGCSTADFLSAVLVMPSGPRPGDEAQQVLASAHVTLLSWRTREQWRLSDPFLSPRVWHRDDNAGRDRGREDFLGRTLRVATFHQPPLAYIDPQAPDKAFGAGWGVLRILAAHFNFTLSTLLLADDNHWGHPVGNTSWEGGALGAVVWGKADLALNVWVQHDQARVVDLTEFIRLSCLTFMVPRPRELFGKEDAVVRPLQIPVWASWLLSVVIATGACRLLDAAGQRVGMATKHFSTLDRSLLSLLGIAVLGSVPPSTGQLGPHRHVVAWWVLFSVLITTAYSSGLICQLTLQRSEQPINSAEDIVRHGLTWASTIKPNLHWLNLENPAEKTLASRTRVVNSSCWDQAVASGQFVVYGQKLDNSYFYWEVGNLSDSVLSQMRVMQHCIRKLPSAIALQKGSPFLRPFNKAILRIKEAGLVSYWQHLVLATRGRRAIFELLRDGSDRHGPQVLSLSQLWSIFRLLGFGLLLASTVFAVECTAAWGHRESAATKRRRKRAGRGAPRSLRSLS